MVLPSQHWLEIQFYINVSPLINRFGYSVDFLVMKVVIKSATLLFKRLWIVWKLIILFEFLGFELIEDVIIALSVLRALLDDLALFFESLPYYVIPENYCLHEANEDTWNVADS